MAIGRVKLLFTLPKCPFIFFIAAYQVTVRLQSGDTVTYNLDHAGNWNSEYHAWDTPHRFSSHQAEYGKQRIDVNLIPDD